MNLNKSATEPQLPVHPHTPENKAADEPSQSNISARLYGRVVLADTFVAARAAKIRNAFFPAWVNFHLYNNILRIWKINHIPSRLMLGIKVSGTHLSRVKICIV